MVRAKMSGERVEVAELTTETQQVFANPSGTLTLEQGTQVQRVRQGGSWVAPDVTLRRRSDGLVSPVATSASLAFSGGGSKAPLARIGSGGRSLALSWPGALPEPVLAGDTATYPEVLPGVDLLVRADVGSFSEVLVVKTAEAAAQPALRTLRFGTDVSGITLRADAGGGFSGVDRFGGEMFSSPQPLMWDSSGLDSAARAGQRETAVSPASVGMVPGDGDQVSPMKLDLGDDSLTVTPDPELLAGGTATFPLFLDPGVKVSPARQAAGMVDSAYPGTAYYNTPSRTVWGGEIGGVGHTDQEGVHTKRLYFRFHTAALARKTIINATFAAYEVFANNCTRTPVSLGIVSTFSGSTTWRNKPGRLAGYPVTSATVAYGRPGCYPAGRWVEINAKPQLIQTANHTWPALHLDLQANESNNSGWKRFNPNATLAVEYNSPPSVPTSLRATSPAMPCVVGANRPAIPNDPPILTARLADADSVKGQALTAEFELWVTGGSRIGDGRPTPPKQAGDFTLQLGTLGAGEYSWRVRARDGVATSAFSSWCQFTVDLTKPSAPTLAAPDGQEYRVDTEVRFTFGSGGSTDVTRYRWSLNADAPTSQDVPVSTAQANVPLRHFGPNIVRVWSYDKAGNVSEIAGVKEFLVAGAGTPAGRWKLDEGASGTSADSVGADRTLTLDGGASWTAGHQSDGDATDHALRFNGTSSVAHTTAPNVVDTAGNFSVSVWVRTTDVSAKRVAVSQGTAANSGFTLGLEPASADGAVPASFAFTMFNADSAAPAGKKQAVVRAELPADPGEWTHLVGIYEAGLHSLSLFVDGEEALQTVDVPFATVQTPGSFRLGRAQTSAVTPAFWSGDIDEASVYAGALDPSQVWSLFKLARSAGAVSLRRS